jgi:hypothetical protein
MTDIREVSLAVTVMKDHLDAILAAINSDLDHDETYEKIMEETTKALELWEIIHQKIEEAGAGTSPSQNSEG